MKYLIFLIVTLSSNLTFAVSANCFSEHILDAIEVNKKRAKIYSKISKGRSLNISNGLIRSEKNALYFSRYLDKRARYFNLRGLPLLCLDYISMDGIQSIPADLVIPTVSYIQTPTVFTHQLQDVIRELYGANKYEELVEILSSYIENELKHTSYNCMLRHGLESIRRSVLLRPHYIASAKARGIRSPKKIIDLNVFGQILSLKTMNLLDRRASGLQEKGIPILCSDVPHVPEPSLDEIESIYF